MEKKTTLSGVARDAKGGAILFTLEKAVIYIEGLDFWPPELCDEQVVVTGILTRKKYIPAPTTDKNGAISTGAEGEQFVLENAEYSTAKSQ